MSAAAHIPIASSGSFLITPNVGLMIWVLVVFLISFLILRRYVFPVIGQALDKRAATISGEIDAAADVRKEAEQMLADYRERLSDARGQADEIVSRAQKAAEAHEREARDAAERKREELLEQTRRDIEAETRRAIQDLRREVADLTVKATEAVTRKVLTTDDQRRLVQDAIGELDFTALSSGASEN
jgi:F-type H+-transporting ATPase subunit b